MNDYSQWIPAVMAGIAAISSTIALLQSKQNAKAAREAAQRDWALKLEVEKIHVVTAKTEKLVNSESGARKRALMIATALAYELKPTEENRVIAEKAKQDLEEHEKSQAAADKIRLETLNAS